MSKFMTITKEDCLLIDYIKTLHGRWVTYNFRDDKSGIGKLYVEHTEVYLCQNDKNGARCSNTFEYKYSWGLGRGKILFSSLGDLKIKVFEDKPSPEDVITLTPMFLSLSDEDKDLYLQAFLNGYEYAKFE